MELLKAAGDVATERIWRGWQTVIRKLLFSLVATAPLLATASTPLEATLGELVQDADHILIGAVVDVDMTNRFGFIVTDPKRMTGPGLPERIRLHIRVDKVLTTNAKQVPAVLKVELDHFMHYSLGQVKEAHAGKQRPSLVLLKGAAFEPIVPGNFRRPLTEREEAMRLYASRARR